MVKIFVERAKNEFQISELLYQFSKEEKLKRKLGIKEDTTFYSGVISHAYYCIFYSAKALLLTKKVKTKAPHIHKKTYEKFKEYFVDLGVLDVKLLNVYKSLIIRADELLGIFEEEKWKRGHFTYKSIPQANEKPANNSLKSAKTFLSNILKII